MFAHEKVTIPVYNRPWRPDGGCARENDQSIRSLGCRDDRDFRVRPDLALHAGRRSRPCAHCRMDTRGRDRFHARHMTDIEMSSFCPIAIMPVYIAGRERMCDVG